MIRRQERTSILRIWLWRIWWNIYATHIKYWSLNLKPRSCTSAARFGITSAGDQFNSPVFVFQHFYKGLCMCSCHVEELCRVRRNPKFLRVGGNVLSDGGKSLCLQARAAAFSGWRGAGPAAGRLLFRSAEQTSVSWLSSGVGRVLKPVRLPAALKNRKDSLSEEGASEWLKRMKKCVNKEQPFLDVSKRGLNSTPDFYMSEYLLNVMEKTRWDRC